MYTIGVFYKDLTDERDLPPGYGGFGDRPYVQDIEIIRTATGIFSYIVSGGALFAYSVSSSGQLSSILPTNYFDGWGGYYGNGSIESFTFNGRNYLFSAASGGFSIRRIEPDGSLFTNVSSTYDNNYIQSGQEVASWTSGGSVYFAIPSENGNSISTIKIDGSTGMTSYLPRAYFDERQPSLGGYYRDNYLTMNPSFRDIVHLRKGGADFVYVSGMDDSALSSFKVLASGAMQQIDLDIARLSRFGAIYTGQSILSHASVGLNDFIFNYSSGYIFSYRVENNGSLTEIDRTRWAPVGYNMEMEVFSYNQRTFALIPGAQSGVLTSFSIMEIDAFGKFHTIRTIDMGQSYRSVSDMEISIIGSKALLLIGETNSTTLLSYEIDLSNIPMGFTTGVARNGTSAADSMLGSLRSDYLNGLGGNDTLTGRDGNDSLFGGSGNDRLIGESGNDVLAGLSGNDILLGGHGSDRINGGSGSDFLNGGWDNTRDVFIFAAISDSTKGATRDTIYGFKSAIDDVDLSRVDSNIFMLGNQAFKFNGNTPKAFSVWFNDIGTDISVRGDVNGDKIFDFEIRITAINSVQVGDFIL